MGFYYVPCKKHTIFRSFLTLLGAAHIFLSQMFYYRVVMSQTSTPANEDVLPVAAYLRRK